MCNDYSQHLTQNNWQLNKCTKTVFVHVLTMRDSADDKSNNLTLSRENFDNCPKCIVCIMSDSNKRMIPVANLIYTVSRLYV